MTNDRGWADSGVSTTTTTGCKGSSFLWYRLPENAHTTTARTLSFARRRSSRIQARIDSFLNLILTANMRGFLFILSVVFTVCCYTANMFPKMAGRCHQRGPTRCCSRFHQHAAGSTACHREKVDKEPLFKVKMANWKEMWY